MSYRARPTFYIFSTDGASHVGQAVLELLTSSDLATSASQSAGITGVSHHAYPQSSFIFPFLFCLYFLLKILFEGSFLSAFVPVEICGLSIQS